MAISEFFSSFAVETFILSSFRNAPCPFSAVKSSPRDGSYTTPAITSVPETTPIEVFEKAIANIKPRIEVRSKRVGGANYQVPMPVNSKRQLSLSMRWLRDAIRKGKGRATYLRVADEIMAAYKGEGTAMTTRENIHRMADANKAFAHFAW